MAGLSDEGAGWALPAFKADAALEAIRRALRDLKLAERGNTFELRGKRVVEWALDTDAITVKVAKRLMLTPEWDRITVKSAADQRKLLDDIKRRLSRWESDE